MDIRKFFGTSGGAPSQRTVAPTSTLTDLKKKTKAQSSAEVSSPPGVRSSPRKAKPAQTLDKSPDVGNTSSKRATSSSRLSDLRNAASSRAVNVDNDNTVESDDVIITLSPPKGKRNSNVSARQDSPKKVDKKAADESSSKKSKDKRAKTDSSSSTGAAKKEKERAFQLLDDDDLDTNDPDDDFVQTKHQTSPKKAGRKRASMSASSQTQKTGKGAKSKEEIEEVSDDEEIHRKKAKVIPKKRATAGEDDDESHEEKKESTKGIGRKKKDTATARILDSDDEELEERDTSALKAERQQKLAMKRALKPDSHGLRNQDITEVVAAASHSTTKPKETAPPSRTISQTKEVSAASFFGTEPVKYRQDVVQTVSTEADESQKPALSPMVVDELDGSKATEQNKSDGRKSLTTPAHSPEKTTKKTPRSQKKTPKSSSEEYVLHAPLSPKITDNGANDSKPLTPAKSPGVTVSTPQSAVDKRRSSYLSFLNREGPRNLGSKELPTGSPTCLEGLAFVFTGVLDSFERDNLKAALEKMGARVVGSVSKKTSYVVVGRDAGVSKIDKIRQLNVPMLDEDGLIELVKSKNKGSPAKAAAASKTPVAKDTGVKKEHKEQPQAKSAAASSPRNPVESLVKTKLEVKADLAKPVPPQSAAEQLKTGSMTKSSSVPGMRPLPPSITSSVAKTKTEPTSCSQPIESVGVAVSKPVGTELWVEKYKPKSVKQIVGQQGDRSCVNKLMLWLRNWNKNLGVKPNTNPFAQNSDGAGFRAALLSGPPGIGKTTSAHLVCKELGISVVEMNASDTRSKKSLESWVSTLLQSKSIDNCGLSSSSAANTNRNPEFPEHCLVMDEVDGMAGNEDRGGIAELIGLIKKSKVPIICICNDRAAQKIRSLANHCFDLRFYKPRPEQIKAAMLSLTCKEGVKIPPEFINEVIEATNADIRQVVNQLQMFSSQSKAHFAGYHARKDVRMGIFQLAEQIFSYQENKDMSIPQRMELFFQDYSLAPLFVQENYLSVWPNRASSVGASKEQQRKAVRLLAQTADSLSYGDVVERAIRSSNDWSLLSAQALLSCAIPSWLVSGTGRVNNFPSWFGKTSHAGRLQRIVQQLALHTSIATGIAGKTNFALDYVPALRRAVTGPLLNEGEAGVAKVIEIFEHYDLIREDLDALLEVDQWPGQPEVWKQVDSKVKASLTRQYNKSGHMTHYAMTTIGGGSKKRGGAAAGGGEEDIEGLLGEDDSNGAGGQEESSSENEDDPMVKANAGRGRGRGAAAGAAGSSRGGASRGGTGRGSRGGRGSKK